MTRRLDRLDDRLLPLIVAALRFRPGRGGGLDARFASRGPLAVVREVPQLGLLAAAVVLIAGAATVVARHPATTVAALPAGTLHCALPGYQPGASTVGPPAGTDLAGYLSARSQLLDSCATADPGRRVLALLSFRTALTPAAALAALAGATVVRLDLQIGSRPPVAADVTGGRVAAAVGAVAANLLADAAAQLRIAGSAPGSDPTTAAGVAFDRATARAERQEAAALLAGRPCVIAAAVQAPLQVLQRAEFAPEVRLVDLAPLGSPLAGVVLVPVYPAEQGRASAEPAPAPFAAGGAQPAGAS